MGRPKKEFPKIMIGFRTDHTIAYTLDRFCQEKEFTRSEAIELALFDFLARFKDKEDMYGVDLKAHADMKKRRKIRDFMKSTRNELKSSHLFMARVKADLMIYVLKGVPVKAILDLLTLYRIEATTYTNYQELMVYVDSFIEGVDKNIEEVKFWLNDQGEVENAIKRKLGVKIDG